MIAGSSVLAELPQALPMVLQTLLKLPACRMEGLPQTEEEGLQASVPLRGVRADGVVRLQLSDSFAARAALLLFGETSDPSVRRDIAGELCNMMAGLIAAKIRDEGGPFTLETPSVAAGVRRPIESGGRMISRSDWDCGGEWLTLEILIPEKDHAA